MPLIDRRQIWPLLNAGSGKVLVLWVALIAPPDARSQQPPPVPPAPTRPDLPALPSPPGSTLTVQPAFSVVIDAAHGGADIGARLANDLLEKDITLALSVRLRSALTARGVAVLTTRESDADIPNRERAGIANHALPAACLVLHATATGSGIHLFTSSLAQAASVLASSKLTGWQIAQAGWVTRSMRLSSEINSALGQAGIPTTLGATSLQPLDSLTCPAVAIEIGPLAASSANKSSPISAPAYQQRILDALTSAMLEWSTEWKQQP